MVANSSQYVRGKLFERDKGVCAMCGVDSEKAKRLAGRASSFWWSRHHGFYGRIESWHRRHRWSEAVPEFLKAKSDRFECWSPRVRSAMDKRIASMRDEGWNAHRRSSWWEADHIVPVVEGGGQCGIENYRTLCVRCHWKVTRELRARLAAKRKETK
jgi:5-methylcytosine-specific restriction endonuclease McrA